MRSPISIGFCITVLTLVGCDSPGEKITVNQGEVYYKGDVTKEQADAVGQFLQKEGIFNGERKSMQLLKTDGTFTLRIVTRPEFLQNEKYKRVWQQMGWNLAKEALGGAPLKIEICDERLKTTDSTEAKAIWGERKHFNKGEVYHDASVTAAEVEHLGKILVSEQFFNGQKKSVMIRKEGKTYQFRFVTQIADANNLQNQPIFKQMANEISKLAFAGAPVEVHLCDDSFDTIKVIK